MNILVCIKQVISAESELKIDDSGTRIKPSGSLRFEMNTYDAYAVEEALQIAETLPGSRVDAITVGPAHAQDTLRRALGMGADEGILILDSRPGYRPPIQTASWIAGYARDKAYDLVLTGIMSEDEMNGQTGPMIAQLLARPFCTAVIQTALSNDGKTLRIEREIEGGARHLFDIRLPCLLTLQTGINTPRYPALSKVLRARKKTIEIIEPDTPKQSGQGLALSRIHRTEISRKGLFLEGTIDEKADQLLVLLANREIL